MELIDTFGREHETLRISVTDRCQMKCFYCLPNGSPPAMPKDQILTFEEIYKIARISADMGIRRIRITGGEPLLRKELPSLIEMISSIPSIEVVAMTTNALTLEDQISALEKAGLTHISISIDSLDRGAFEKMTGLDALEKVMNALEKIKKTSIDVEINAVAIKGWTEKSLKHLIQFSRAEKIPVRFIELMPFEDIEWDESKLLTGEEILNQLKIDFPDTKFKETPRARESAPSRRFTFEDGKGGFGLIEPVSRPFCDKCDRLRLRSDGQLFNCLFARNGFDLRGPVREGDEDKIRNAFLDCVKAKEAGGMLDFAAQKENPARIMPSIGG